MIKQNNSFQLPTFLGILSPMGLMYIFPIDESETDRVEITPSSITLKSYGLPMVFWGYLAAILTVVFTMWLSIKSSLDKLLTYDDASMIFLYWLVASTLVLGPIILLGFFFYEKQIAKSKSTITITHKIFFIPVLRRKITLDSFDSLSVDHFLDSPNMAIEKNFEVKGYFKLHGISNGKKFFLDRQSGKTDLLKMKDLLLKY